jgi:PAS domain-containing protein
MLPGDGQAASPNRGIAGSLAKSGLPAGYVEHVVSCAKIDQPMPTEDEIREILAQTDKFLPEDELNCGACGYNSCREKAIAVYRGMAEVEMCIPYMRRRAESMSNLIISSTPNAIVAVDRDLNIVLVNPSFESVFPCQRGVMRGAACQCSHGSRAFSQGIRDQGIDVH